MVMEHRWGVRWPIDINATLNIHPFGLAEGQVRDLSVSGAFVHTGVDLSLNTRVELMLPLRKGTVTQIQRLAAVVARHANGGIGLMFTDLNPDKFDQLVSQLAHSPE